MTSAFVVTSSSTQTAGVTEGFIYFTQYAALTGDVEGSLYPLEGGVVQPFLIKFSMINININMK